MRLEDHAGDAKSALCRALDEERLLQRMQHGQIVLGLQIVRGRGESLDGHDVLARRPPGSEQACLGRLAAHQYDAATAFAVVARLLGAREIEIFAQKVEQGGRSGIHPDGFSIHGQLNIVLR